MKCKPREESNRLQTLPAENCSEICWHFSHTQVIQRFGTKSFDYWFFHWDTRDPRSPQHLCGEYRGEHVIATQPLTDGGYTQVDDR